MDNKTNNKRGLDAESTPSSSSSALTDNTKPFFSSSTSSSTSSASSPANSPPQQNKKRIKSQPASETKVISINDYLYPVVLKNRSGKLYKIHVNIIEKSDVIKTSIENNILNLPEYYNEPELTDRTAALLNIIVKGDKLPSVMNSSNIKLCQILHARNIKLSKEQCIRFASLSMFIPAESKTMYVFDVSCVSPNDQVFPYVVDHIVDKCKVSHNKWGHYNLLKNLNNQAVFDAVLQKIFATARH